MVKNQDYFHINYVLFSPQNIEKNQKNQGQKQEENLEQDSESDEQNDNNDQNKKDQPNFYNYKIYFTSPFLVDVKDNLKKCIKWKISTDYNIKKKFKRNQYKMG
ncbi:hypothetical protein PPERSA_10512 [Pseudocohnilembus persalinus]|uniref:Uncharacterized protein n=1 Tax=Pseudocohnilembus persalinus TaxID=266149 RepID=A0A0V0R7C2_PSEPJ|nr:hypothetical protein PPERSA_10512 [Pseudocohnilembus persalinus]|eukprot:KRX10413.1 hypothetical protein PPERSA_10512 [Pseudocohnilembus persalinus]